MSITPQSIPERISDNNADRPAADPAPHADAVPTKPSTVGRGGRRKATGTPAVAVQAEPATDSPSAGKRKRAPKAAPLKASATTGRVKPTPTPATAPASATIGQKPEQPAAVANDQIQTPAKSPTKEGGKDKKPKKPKLVRDSFAMPKDEYAAIEQLKHRALAQGHAVKKSELLRAGLRALSALGDAQLMRVLKSVPTLKTGRPGKQA